eukprot:4748683-Pleurochrysis_carterae.AAC.1
MKMRREVVGIKGFAFESVTSSRTRWTRSHPNAPPPSRSRTRPVQPKRDHPTPQPPLLSPSTPVSPPPPFKSSAP